MSRRGQLLTPVLAVFLLAGLSSVPSARAENVDQTVRVRPTEIQITAYAAEGQIDLQVGKTLYRYFIRKADAAALPKAVAAKVEQIKAATVVEIRSVPYGEYRKVTKLRCLTGGEERVAAKEKALGTPYNGCGTRPKLAKKVSGRTAYEAAEAEARAWHPDALLNEMQTLRDAPLDAAGTSSSWVLQFFSAEARQLNSITVTAGEMSCNACRSTPVPTLDIGPDIILDTKQIYTAARKRGGSEYTAAGYTVSAGLISGFQGVPSWYLSYEPPGGRGGGKTIIVDARVDAGMDAGGSRGAASTTASKNAVSALIDDLLRGTGSEERKRAAEALGDLGLVAKAALPALIQALQHDQAPEVRAGAAAALGEMGPVVGKEAVPALNAALGDPDAFVKQAARNALFRVDPRR